MSLFSNDSTTNQTTNNISPAAASQSGEGAQSASVVSEGNVTINQQTVDAGVFDLAEEVIYLGSDTVIESFDFAGKSQQESLDFVGSALDGGSRFISDLANNVLGLARDSIDSANSSAASATAAAQRATQESLDFGRDSLAVVGDALQENTGLSLAVIDFAEEVGVSSQQFALSAVDNVVQTVADLEERRGIETAQVLDTVTTLGETVATGGESLQSSVNKMIGLAAVTVLGFVAWRAVGAR